MRQLQFAVIAGAAYKRIIHKLHARRIQPRFDQVRHQTNSFIQIGKDCQQIQFIRTQRQQL